MLFVLLPCKGHLRMWGTRGTMGSPLPDYDSHGAVGRLPARRSAARSRRSEKMADVAVGKDKCGEQRLVSLPLSRIRVIMKSSPEVSSINQEALVLTAKATVRRPTRREERNWGGRGRP